MIAAVDDDIPLMTLEQARRIVAALDLTATAPPAVDQAAA